MATPAANERVRAARIRHKLQEGKPLKPEEKSWFGEYERKTLRGVVRAARAADNENEQLSLPGVHETTPETERVDPAAHTWTPTMPPESADAPPTPDGMPKPPAAGTPLVDNATAAPTGDPEAAKQFATFVQFIVQLGISAGRELATTSDEVPDQARAMLMSDELAVGVLTTVGAAAERVAIKYNFQKIPLADELIVAGAVVGSGALLLQQHKRKKAREKSPAAATTQPNGHHKPNGVKEPAQPPSDFESKMWGGN